MSVSATTRPPRAGELNGREYHFLDAAQFQSMIETDALLEFATVFGNRYGTPTAPVEAALSVGSDVLFDIDWQGTQQLRQRAHGDVVSIFILPPSMDELERRLRSRAEDDMAVIAARMARAADEISHWAEYDYVLVNREVETCLGEVRTILGAERLRRARQPWLTDFARSLEAGA